MSERPPRTKPRRVVRRLHPRGRGSSSPAPERSGKLEQPSGALLARPAQIGPYEGLPRDRAIVPCKRLPDFDRIYVHAQQTMGRRAPACPPHFSRVHLAAQHESGDIAPLTTDETGGWRLNRQAVTSILSAVVAIGVLVPVYWQSRAEPGAPASVQSTEVAGANDQVPKPSAVLARSEVAPPAAAELPAALAESSSPARLKVDASAVETTMAASLDLAERAAGSQHVERRAAEFPREPSVPLIAATPAGPPPANPEASEGPTLMAGTLRPAPTVVRPADGTFFVQLASFARRGAARSAWLSLKAEFAEVLGQHDYRVVSAELGKGEVHRLRAGPFPGLAEAKTVCQRLKRASGDCFVVEG